MWLEERQGYLQPTISGLCEFGMGLYKRGILLTSFPHATDLKKLPTSGAANVARIKKI